MNFLYFSIFIVIINSIFIVFYEKIGKFYNLYDFPIEKRKIHKKPVPLLGGLIFLINFILFFIFEILFNNDSFFNDIFLFSNRQIFIFFLCFLTVFFIGFIDDKLKLSPMTKLILLSSACYGFFSINQFMIINYIELGFLNMVIDLFELGLIFSIICVVFYVNSINMMDGINLIVSLYLVSTSIILLLFNFQINFAVIMMISSLFFIYLNSKGKIFLGDSGSYFISFIIAFVIISLYETKNLPSEQIIIFMFLPIIDSIRLFFLRIFSGKNPFHPDSNHLHFILLNRLGFKKTISLLFILFLIPILSVKLTVVEPIFILVLMILLYLTLLKLYNVKV